jgi:hypothetical protein
MAESTLNCPSCGTAVGLGDIECPSCGLNLKSGESYESRVKQAKGKAAHPEHFTAPIYGGVLLAAAVILFAGLKWQGTCEESMRQKPEWFDYAVLQMQTVDDLVAEGQYALRDGDREAARQSFEEARTTAQELATWLREMAAAIQPDETEILTGQPKKPKYYGRQEEQYNEKVVKRLLVALQKKAERKLEQIPAV